MADSSLIDSALLARLGNDATLAGYMPDGVFWDEASAGKRRFVIVSLLDHADGQIFEGRAWEDALYLVKAVALTTATNDTTMKAAAARIDELLNEQPLTITDHVLMTMHREARVRITEVDDRDPSLRWWHRGGHYRLMATAPEEAIPDTGAFDTEAFA